MLSYAVVTGTLSDNCNILLAVLEFEKLYLENLPSSEAYEKSYMHRDVVRHLAVTK